jgi:hypothetical protein
VKEVSLRGKSEQEETDREKGQRDDDRGEFGESFGDKKGVEPGGDIGGVGLHAAVS